MAVRVTELAPSDVVLTQVAVPGAPPSVLDAVHDLPLLTRADIRTFDGDAQQLVQDFQEAGWRGYMTSRGHAFMLAPDRKTTANVSRESLRGRSGRNARAKLTAWLRDNGKAATAFGTPTPEPESPITTLAGNTDAVTGALVRSVRGHPAIIAWHEEHPQMAYRLHIVGDPAVDSVTAWAAFDILNKRARLVAMGDAATPELAWDWLRGVKPELFKGKRHDSGKKDTTMRVATAAVEAVNNNGSNGNGHHEDVPEKFICSVCGKESKSLGGHRLHTSSHETANCPVCGKEVRGSGPLARHMSTHQVKIKRSDEKKPEPETAKPDVLSEHLISVPDGADAEAMVAAMRAIVAAPLVDEVRLLREANARLTADNVKLDTELGEAKARLSVMREALNL